LVQSDYLGLWDLGTGCKTEVNGEILDQAILNAGDVITLGQVDLRFGLRLRRTGAGAPENARTLLEIPRLERASPGPLKGPITAQSVLEGRRVEGGKAFGKVLGKRI
jgi:hypothetical protein